MENQTINFSYNWNNKLTCKCFTSIRIANDNKYREGLEYDILLKNKFLKKCKLVKVEKIFLSELDEFRAYCDTGYNLQSTKDIILKMYPKINFEKTKIALLLFVEVIDKNLP